jgi:hypothetical protein
MPDTLALVAPPSGLPAISPTRGEIGCHFGFRQSLTQERRQQSGRRNLPPCGGDVRQDRGGQRRAQTLAYIAREAD